MPDARSLKFGCVTSRRLKGGALSLLAVTVGLFALSYPGLALYTAVANHAPLDRLTSDAIRLLVGVPLVIVACAGLIGGRDFGLSFALACFALSRAAQPARIWVQALPSPWMWLGLALAALVAGASVYGFVVLCLRIPTGKTLPRWRAVDRWLPAYAILLSIVYALSALWSAHPGDKRADGAYAVFAVMIWIAYACGLLAYLDRRRIATGDELLRTRWVAIAIAMHVGLEAAFLGLNLTRNHGVFASYLFMLNPAAYAFAYALVSGRIVDARVFGGRALVYAVVTSIPIALIAIADWLFAKELENVRLAGIVAVAIAVAFSFWLQTLHRRIDSFVERVLFVRRHQAHKMLAHMADALAFVERPDTIGKMLVGEVRATLDLTCAALFRPNGNGYERSAEAGCNDMPSRLDADDPLVLYSRASRSLVTLADLNASKAEADYAQAVIRGDRVFAVVLYGEHRSGEGIDAEEAVLIQRLAHAAANAYEHLLLVERDREIADLRGRLLAFER